jgi:hypothetical protein
MNSIEYTKLLNEFRKLNAKMNGITKQLRRMRVILEGPELSVVSKFDIATVDDLMQLVEENNLKPIRYTHGKK